MHGAQIFVVFEHFPALINRAELALIQGKRKTDRAWVRRRIHSTNDEIMAAGQGMFLHVGKNRIDAPGVKKHQGHGTGNESVVGIQSRLIDIIHTRIDSADAFLRDDGLQHLNGICVAVHCGDIETQLAQVQGITPIGAPRRTKDTPDKD